MKSVGKNRSSLPKVVVSGRAAKLGFDRIITRLRRLRDEKPRRGVSYQQNGQSPASFFASIFFRSSAASFACVFLPLVLAAFLASSLDPSPNGM